MHISPKITIQKVTLDTSFNAKYVLQNLKALYIHGVTIDWLFGNIPLHCSSQQKRNMNALYNGPFVRVLLWPMACSVVESIFMIWRPHAYCQLDFNTKWCTCQISWMHVLQNTNIFNHLPWSCQRISFCSASSCDIYIKRDFFGPVPFSTIHVIFIYDIKPRHTIIQGSRCNL